MQVPNQNKTTEREEEIIGNSHCVLKGYQTVMCRQLMCSWVCVCAVHSHEGSWDIPSGCATFLFYCFSYFKTLILSLKIHEMPNSGQTDLPWCLLLKYLQFTSAADRSVCFICEIQAVLFMFQNLRFQTISVHLKVNIGLNPTCF